MILKKRSKVGLNICVRSHFTLQTSFCTLNTNDYHLDLKEVKMRKKSKDRKQSLMDTLDKIFKVTFALLCAAGVVGLYALSWYPVLHPA